MNLQPENIRVNKKAADLIVVYGSMVYVKKSLKTRSQQTHYDKAYQMHRYQRQRVVV